MRIRFHVSGDYLYPPGNWWIDDVVVSQAMVPGACATAPAGPPPIPDGGAVPGAPVQVSTSGGDLLVIWDATRGAATDGSYGRDLSGPERTYAGASLVCPAIAQHLTDNGCP